MMIRKIKLNNFQAHLSSEIEFHTGINAIVGRSDSGKSSIIRAINWAKDNRPLSNNYPNESIVNAKGNLTGESSVEIINDRGNLKRTKDKDFNGYSINGNVLKAIGSELPSQVIDFFDMNGVNVQRQLDSHFLLSETPGQVAKFLNELVNLSDIDLYFSAAEKKKRKIKVDMNYLAEEIDEKQKEIKSLDWVDGARELLEEIKQIKNELDEIIFLKAKIKSNIESGSAAQEKFNLVDLWIVNAEGFVNTFPEYEKCRENYSQLATMTTDYANNKRKLSALKKYIPEISEMLNESESIQKKLNDVESKKAILSHGILIASQQKTFSEFDIDKAETYLFKIDIVKDKISVNLDESEVLANLLSNYEKINSQLDKVKENIETISANLPELVCPECGADISGVCL